MGHPTSKAGSWIALALSTTICPTPLQLHPRPIWVKLAEGVLAALVLLLLVDEADEVLSFAAPLARRFSDGSVIKRFNVVDNRLRTRLGNLGSVLNLAEAG